MKFNHDKQNLVTFKDEIIFEDAIKEESNWEDTWSLEDIPVDLQSDVDLDDFDSIDQSANIPHAQSSCGPSCSPIPSTSKAAYARENRIEVQSSWSRDVDYRERPTITPPLTLGSPRTLEEEIQAQRRQNKTDS